MAYRFSLFCFFIFFTMSAQAVTISSLATSTNFTALVDSDTVASSVSKSERRVVSKNSHLDDVWALKLDQGQAITISFFERPFYPQLSNVHFGIDRFQMNSGLIMPFAYNASGIQTFRMPAIWKDVDAPNHNNTYGFRSSVVPIPASVWLIGSTLIGLITLGRRKSHFHFK